MKSLLLIPLIFVLTSFLNKDNINNEPVLLGRLELYLTSDKQVVLLYKGTYPYCYMKYATDILFVECDTMVNMKVGFDSCFYGLHVVPIDELLIEPIDTIEIKKTRM